jgi:uncharacterized YceG family protein
MTEYGRGQGSEPWYPEEDPLFGTGQGYSGPPTGGHPQVPYDGQGQQPYPQQPYPQPQPQQTPQPYQAPQPHQAQWGGPPQQPGWGGPHQQPPPNQPQPQHPQSGGWDTTGGMPAVDPYGQPRRPAGGPDPYGTPEAYPPPRPRPRGGERPRPQDWESRMPREREHSFFADDPEDLDDSEHERAPRRRRPGPPPGGPRSGRGRSGAKKRSGCACAVVAAVLVGLVGGGGYYGYTFYQDRFGAAPDFQGEGTGTALVTIPDHSTITQIGNILKDAGVVKSVDGFVQAADDNDKSGRIQPGTYSLHKEMSSAAAIEMLLDPKTANALVIPEGRRASTVYALIDQKLGAEKGTTAKVAEEKYKSLGLPSWALNHKDVKDPLDGFLFPSRYSAAKGMKPEDVLKQMVKRANAEYTRDGVAAGAKKLGKSPYEIITLASLIEAEGDSADTFAKVSRVVYNRLKTGNTQTNGKLDFDSTINYAKNRSKLDTSNQDTRFASPYNTYLHPGLPPGPIDNPGRDAVEAALHPAKGDWLYFVTVKPGLTRFTASKAEHDKNVAEFNRWRRDHPDG